MIYIIVKAKGPEVHLHLLYFTLVVCFTLVTL